MQGTWSRLGFVVIATAACGCVDALPSESSREGAIALRPRLGCCVEGSGSADGPGRVARFFSPEGVAADGAGNVYVADTKNHTIRKITPAGFVTTLAGAAGVGGSADGVGAGAQFNFPGGVAADRAGIVYVADTNNHTIRKVRPDGVVTTLAGAAGVEGSADGAAADAQFSFPESLAVDDAGNLFVTDTGNDTIRKISPAGVVTTLAGSPQQSGDTDGRGAGAQFSGPHGIAVNRTGHVFVADTGNDTIRKISPRGVVITLAGAAGMLGSMDGTGADARFAEPFGVAVNRAGKLFVADVDDVIRKISPAGVVTTFAGTAGAFGRADGTGAAAQLDHPDGVAVDDEDNVYVADHDNNSIRKITRAGVVTTLAGFGAE
jgi:sugar lactone lactonase YvrE